MSHSTLTKLERHLLAPIPHQQPRLGLHPALDLASTASCLDSQTAHLLPALPVKPILHPPQWSQGAPYYVQGTKISVKLPSAFHRHGDKTQSIAGTPEAPGDFGLC